MNRTGLDYDSVVDALLDGKKLSIAKNPCSSSVSSLSIYSNDHKDKVNHTQQLMGVYQTVILPKRYNSKDRL